MLVVLFLCVCYCLFDEILFSAKISERRILIFGFLKRFSAVWVSAKCNYTEWGVIFQNLKWPFYVVFFENNISLKQNIF